MRSKLAVGGLTVAVAFLLATNPVVVDAAGQITGKQIRNNSITGKDVKEKSLKTVPKAKNAETLGGLAPAAYLNQSYRYRLPAGTPATSKTFSFPGVPAGSYLVTYQTAILGGAPIFCKLSADNTSFTLAGEAVSISAGTGSLTNSGSALLAVAAGKVAGLLCQSGANFQVYGGTDALSSVTFTRIDTLTDLGTSTVARSATESSKGFAG